MSLNIGFAVEKRARTWLVAQGMQFVTGNYRCRWGEVDLIMQDGEHLVFVEVRARVSREYGGAVASITPAKQKKIVRTALHYMTVNRILEKYPARFDVLSAQGSDLQFEWIKDAFRSDG